MLLHVVLYTSNVQIDSAHSKPLPPLYLYLPSVMMHVWHKHTHARTLLVARPVVAYSGLAWAGNFWVILELIAKFSRN